MARMLELSPLTLVVVQRSTPRIALGYLNIVR